MILYSSEFQFQSKWKTIKLIPSLDLSIIRLSIQCWMRAGGAVGGMSGSKSITLILERYSLRNYGIASAVSFIQLPRQPDRYLLYPYTVYNLTTTTTAHPWPVPEESKSIANYICVIETREFQHFNHFMTWHATHYAPSCSTTPVDKVTAPSPFMYPFQAPLSSLSISICQPLSLHS